jgi:hypothetical protein
VTVYNIFATVSKSLFNIVKSIANVLLQSTIQEYTLGFHIDKCLPGLMAPSGNTTACMVRPGQYLKVAAVVRVTTSASSTPTIHRVPAIVAMVLAFNLWGQIVKAITYTDGMGAPAVVNFPWASSSSTGDGYTIRRPCT